MSALGHKRTFAVHQPMSALPPIATAKALPAKGHVCFTPESGHVRCNYGCPLWANSGHFKPPKSEAGRRDITLPDILVDVLRDYRKAQLELRVRLGAGKLHDNDLLFADLEGAPLSPNAISAAWSDYAKQIGMPEVTFHALRHTHASQLIDRGVDIVTISRRLGHAKPDITLRIYAHLFRKDDSMCVLCWRALPKGGKFSTADPSAGYLRR
jgi:hypothetical protein